MKIDVKKFSKIQDIYISPDPQEHRPAWIWFAYIDDDLAVAAGRGRASSWWNSAMISRKGQIHIDNVQVIAGTLLGRKILDRQ